uniref:Uncharacterized protein n=1 Tax=Oryza glumipatula TaxID=40148 RepID=A0A0D9ZUJ1_9ORYZ
MASAMNGCGGGGGGGGVMKRMGLLRVQYYCVMGAVAAAVVLATLLYMPAPATAPPTVAGVDGGGATVRSSAAAVDAAAAAAPGGGGVERGKGKRKHVWSGEEEEVAAEKKAAAGVVVFNFGDSNSDTGGVAAVMGIHIAAPEGRAYFHHPTGRLSDGRVILDFIYYSNGVNFAMAGSTVSHGVSPYSLNVQVDQFVYFKHRSLELFERGQKGPVSKEGFENALYMMDIGHNDVAGVMHTPSDNWDKKFSKIVSEIKDAIRILYDNGARKFWIHGTGALGCLPALVVQEKGEHDAHGCLANYNKAARQFNKKLSHLCDEMRLHLKNATIVYTDMFAIKYDFVANHTKYGIKWPLMVCCGNGGPPYNFKPGKFGCDDLCEPGSKVLSWDGVHFTDFGSGLAAKLAMSGEYSKPKVKLASLVNAGSNKSSDS